MRSCIWNYFFPSFLMSAPFNKWINRSNKINSFFATQAIYIFPFCLLAFLVHFALPPPPLKNCIFNVCMIIWFVVLCCESLFSWLLFMTKKYRPVGWLHKLLVGSFPRSCFFFSSSLFLFCFSLFHSFLSSWTLSASEGWERVFPHWKWI